MLSNLMYLSGNALLNAQFALSQHGNNVSNASTEGYTRRTVTLQNMPGIDAQQGVIGTGAQIQSIVRHLNSYLEEQQTTSNGNATMWDTAYARLSSIEKLFTDAKGKGVSGVFDQFWKSWGTVAQNPDNAATRSTLLEHTKTLLSQLATIRSGLNGEIDNLNKAMTADVEETNTLMQDIAAVNKQLLANPSKIDLQDRQSILINKLSTKLDVRIQGAGTGNLTVVTHSGQTLVSGKNHYSVKIHQPEVIPSLTHQNAITFDGKVYFEGTSGKEIKIDVLSGGPTNGSAGAAKFRVSLDGGKTWVTNADGTEKQFTASGSMTPVSVNGVKIWFGSASNPAGTATNNLHPEDSFTVVAKRSIHWHKTTAESVNITPHSSKPDANDARLSGGSLAAHAMVRDHSVRDYLERLGKLAKKLIWQVNAQHTKGAGLTPFSTVTGDAVAERTNVPLAQSGLPFAEKIRAGDILFAIYNKSTGNKVALSSLTFPAPNTTFNPAVHSMENIRDAINSTFSGQLTASITNGQLRIDAGATFNFHVSGDTTGFLAAAGINTFFKGSGLNDIAVATAVTSDPNRLNAGHVNGAGEANKGDSFIAKAIKGLETTKTGFSTPNGAEHTMTMSSYLHNTIATVGQHTLAAKNQQAITSTLQKQLNTMQQANSGVNVDEEMVRVMQWQKNFQAASQMIKTADKLFDIVLSLKN